MSARTVSVSPHAWSSLRARDNKGKAIGFLLISKDISDEIRLTEELRATRYYARSLIEASLDPLVTISPEGKITDVNEASIKVTGVAREKLIGTDFSDYFTEPEKARAGYQQVFSKGFGHRLPADHPAPGRAASPTCSTTPPSTRTTGAKCWASSPPLATSPRRSRRRNTPAA